MQPTITTAHPNLTTVDRVISMLLLRIGFLKQAISRCRRTVNALSSLAARARIARKPNISPLKLGRWTDTEFSTYLARERAAVRSSLLCTVVVISSLRGNARYRVE
jgi:hypothetical protein